jgi:membrane fusion protein, multidrug efflux system
MTEQQNTNTEPATKNNIKRKHLLLILTAIFLLAGIIYLIYWLFIGQFYEATDDAYVNGNLVQVMSQIPGQVTTILADETDLVKKGQPVIILDQADTKIALDRAESQLAVTTRQVSQYFPNVEELKSKVVQQQADLEKVKGDLQRRQKLIATNVISREDFQHAQIAVDSAAAALALSKHQLAAAIDLVANSDLYHHPQTQQAIVNLRNAYLNWLRTTIYAPETGYVAKRPVQVGQQVNTNTILMIIIPLNQIWVDANFKETQLKNIRIGQPATLISDAYGRAIEYQGTVIGLSPGTGSSFDLLPPQNATGNWIKIVQRLPVRIIINPKQLADFPLRIGLSIAVTINTHDRSGPVLTPLPQTKVIYQTRNYSDRLKQADQLINRILKTNAKNVSYPASQELRSMKTN